jgi:predicted glycogen debranching enzyme
MDAKIGDWVVTPRHGKPVEVQALWYNALRIMEHLAHEFGDDPRRKRYSEMAELAQRSFEPLFWNESANCLYDVVNGDTRDGSIRPNQVFAVSLPHSMLSAEKARCVVAVIERELLTPVGLRTLAPGDPQYRPRFEGDPRSRDSAYHQGTVWPWLMGPFLTAYVKVEGGTRKARERAARLLDGLRRHLLEEGLGQVSEVAARRTGPAAAPRKPGVLPNCCAPPSRTSST